jgi:peptide/nickel transport system substrate-binding protein/microcin C transport system substrate-binding protein
MPHDPAPSLRGVPRPAAGGAGRWRAGLLLCALALALGGGLARADAPARGNPQAPVGGVLRNRFSTQPSTLHPLNATDLYANHVLERIYETLAETDAETLAFNPLLAERWEVSADHRVYTFHLNPKARWQDGQPVTAEDVKFSFDVLFNEKLKTRAKWAAYYGNFERAEALDARTVRFTARADHYKNFINLALNLRIVPKARFGADPNETPLAKQPLGSGPYRLDTWNRGASIVLQRNPDYWGADLPQNRGRYNPGRVLTRFVKEDKVALEELKKGDLDILTLSPEQWVRETGGAEFGPEAGAATRIVKLEMRNRAPRGYSYVGYNLGSPLFGDKRVRRAMGLLYDRDTYIDKFFHGLQVKAVGPFDVTSPYTSPNVKPLGFSVAEALRLLREAGWKDSDGDGLLDKDGRAFRFTVMTANPEISVKILTLAKESMRQAGVEMNIKVVDWTTFLTLIDEYKYDAVMLGWTRESFPDVAPLWHSRYAVAGGLNLVRYQNPEVDRLIDAAEKSIPERERIRLFRRIHELLFEDQPYTFMLEPDRSLVAYQRRFQYPRPYFNYSLPYQLGEEYWWMPAQVK